MAKVKKNIRKMYLHASSLIEVIVSTIIIIIGFLLFSFLLSQLMSSRRVVPETEFLLRLPSLQTENGALDTTEISKIFQETKIVSEIDANSQFNLLHNEITDRNNGVLIMQYYTLPDCQVDALFQK